MDITSVLVPLLMILVGRIEFIFLSKTKMHVTISSFKAYAKKQSGYTIKILRTNKGIEHIIYDDFLKKKRVWFEY